MTRRLVIRAVGLVLALGSAGVSAAPARAGSLNVLTYNVAGLPEGVSSSHPAVNTIQISPLLNAYDLVAVQEDFFYHEELVTLLTLPYQSDPDPMDDSFGDGLNRFADAPFTAHTRVTWNDCFGILDSGSDCLTTKGFSVARHEIESGVLLDVYNLHADAGRDPGSNAARQGNVRQLYAYIQDHSAGNAVLVLGDTNNRYTDAADIMPELLAMTGLADVWIELARGGVLPDVGSPLSDCSDPGGPSCEVVDKILYRSSAQLVLTPMDYAVLEDPFLDSDGAWLSDHRPVNARFAFRVVPEPGLLGLALAALGAVAAGRRANLRAT